MVIFTSFVVTLFFFVKMVVRLFFHCRIFLAFLVLLRKVNVFQSAENHVFVGIIYKYIYIKKNKSLNRAWIFKHKLWTLDVV